MKQHMTVTQKKMVSEIMADVQAGRFLHRAVDRAWDRHPRMTWGQVSEVARYVEKRLRGTVWGRAAMARDKEILDAIEAERIAERNAEHSRERQAHAMQERKGRVLH